MVPALVEELADSFKDSQIINIALDDCPEVFAVQKALLCNTSEYFTKALSEKFKEGNENTLRLPGCDAEVFKLFLYWLCKRELPDWRLSLAKEAREPDEYYVNRYQHALVRTWAFGEAYLLPKLQNKAMARLLAALGAFKPDVDTVKEVYENTAATSVLRQVITKEVVCRYRRYRRAEFTDPELMELGRIDGFFLGFMDQLHECVVIWDDSHDVVHRAYQGPEAAHEEYMVDEDEDVE